MNKNEFIKLIKDDLNKKLISDKENDETNNLMVNRTIKMLEKTDFS